jgi:ribosomal protein S12 methylthiotransferase accessory factor
LNDLPLGKVQETVGGQLERRFSYDDLLQSCSERGIDIWEFDATRQDLGIPCVKLLSPHLCGWEPRFGKARLYQGVVDRGLRSSPAEEAEFAARPFPF